MGTESDPHTEFAGGEIVDPIDAVEGEQASGNADADDDDDDDDDDDENDIVNDVRYCTFAVTGPTPSFQAIFVCNECFYDEKQSSSTTTAALLSSAVESPTTPLAPLCICRACAEICHQDDDDHYVEYIGMGPSYCDCNRMGGCKIFQLSQSEADRLGITRTFHDERTSDPPKHLSSASPNGEKKNNIDGPASIPDDDDTSRRGPSVAHDVFDIPFLHDESVTDLLVRQAQELIRHTKDSHWINEATMNAARADEISELESFAWSICQSHKLRYEELFSGDGVDDRGGAEWWVQVKEIISNFDGEMYYDGSSCSSSSIGLHYDKDEALAESFGIGSFPSLSTVTYLTPASPHAAPTVVFDHTYSQGEDEVMHTMLASRPRLGKHLVFDGRLLHGAPSHLYLQPLDTIGARQQDGDAGSRCDDVPLAGESVKESEFRVTFLVNIWKDRRPANVKNLDHHIRRRIMDLNPSDPPLVAGTTDGHPNDIIMTQLTIPKMVLGTEKDLPEVLRRRIELPFVTDDETGDGVGNSVVVTFPPPPNYDTVSVSFGPGMQAYIDYSADGSQNVEDPPHSASEPQQFEYV